MSTRRRASTRAMKALRPVLEERCGGRCEFGGEPLRVRDDGSLIGEIHHRVRRNSRNDTADNTVLLCTGCHTAAPDAVHRNVSDARRAGFIVPTWQDPETTPIRYMGVRDVLLGRDGSVSEVLLDSLTLCTACAHAAGDHRDGDGMCTNTYCDCNRMETER